jgi:4-hydroxy-2-oxoheptanedioate aldolase
MRANRIKKIWKAGGAVVNVWLAIPSAYSAELISHQGFDALTIDLQHGIVDYQDMIAMAQAIATTDTVPIVRVTGLNSAEINKVLDGGAYGVICPLVEERAQAELLVQSVKYPPRGMRSWGPSRGILYGGSDYFEHADEEIAVFAQIETAKALQNIDEILSVPGIDAAYIGPFDLSISLALGLPTAEPSGTLKAAFAQVLQACRHHGVAAGIHSVPGIRPAELIQQGFQFVTAGMDIEFLIKGALSARTSARPERA